MYTVLSPLRFAGPECAISSFSEYILCAKSSFHLRNLTGSHIGRVGTLGSCDRVEQGSNPDGFVCLV